MKRNAARLLALGLVAMIAFAVPAAADDDGGGRSGGSGQSSGDDDGVGMPSSGGGHHHRHHGGGGGTPAPQPTPAPKPTPTPAPQPTPAPKPTPTPAPTPPPAPTLTYTANVAPILAANCTGCHNGSNQFSLKTYAQVSGYVVPGNSGQSKLVTSTQPGGKMAGFITAADAATIQQWVDQGAAQ